MLRHFGLICLVLLAGLLSACNRGSPADNPAESDPPSSLEIEANGPGVWLRRSTTSEAEAVAVESPVKLAVGQSVVVEPTGRATVRLPDLLTAELSGGGELTLASFSVDDQTQAVTLRQQGGLLLADFNPNRRREPRLTLEMGAVTLSTSAAQFLVVQQGDSLLTWLVNLGEADDQLEVSSAAGSQPVDSNTARWVDAAGMVSAAIPVDSKRLRGWYNSVQSQETVLTLAEVLLSPANLIATTGALPALPRLGQPFELLESDQGTVKLTLDPVGLFGRPDYALDDCNRDGSQDIVIRSGKLRFDFRPLLARVLALDVTVLNRAQPDSGALAGQGTTGNEMDRALLEAGPGESQTLNLRADQPFYTAELAMLDGCFMGFSLTPPDATGVPAEPRAAVTAQPVDAVVNILATPAPRAGEANQLEAARVGAGAIQIDGQLNDWAQTGSAWTEISAVTFDQDCAIRFPDSGRSIDLAGQVRFAYDDQNLYVAFQVDDDGYVGYTGDDERYFLDDSVQLSLDLDLLGDFNEAGRNQDDWQVDFLPDAESPRVGLWQLGSLTSRRFDEAQVAVSLTETGYLVEAALPWRSFGVTLQPGDRLGLAANINDNDTPGRNNQECIISTAPQRKWDDPTSWGSLLLKPED